MNCACGGETEVKDSRPFAGSVKRRRVCLKCKKSFFTLERLLEEKILRIMKKAKKLNKQTV